MPVFDILGFVKILFRGAIIALLSPWTVVAAVISIVAYVVDQITELLDRIDTDFLSNLGEFPIEYLEDWISGTSSGGSFAGWFYYAFGMDWILAVVKHIPDVLYWLLVSCVGIFTAFFATVVAIWIRSLIVNVINTAFSK